MPWWLWGVQFLVVGIVFTAVSQRYVRWVFLAGGALVWTEFASSLLFAFLTSRDDPTSRAALYPVAVYGWLAAVHVRLALRCLRDYQSVL